MTPEQRKAWFDTLDKVEQLFKSPGFKGEFDMNDWGRHGVGHEPHENNWCGTSACLAGWMATVNEEFAAASDRWWNKEFPNNTVYATMNAERGALIVFGLPITTGHVLFRSGFGCSLEEKLAQARSIDEGGKLS